MDKTFNRRGFLRTSFLGAGTFLVSFTPLKMFATAKQTDPSDNQASIIDADELYKQAKEYFYRKEYKSAENIYLQLIESFPQRIFYYDGYSKVLGAQQRLLEIAELYRVGLNLQEKNPYFMHRLALSLKSLCTGNRKAEKLFVGKTGIENLLIYSAELLLSAIAIKPIKGFMLDLRDIPSLVTDRNEMLINKGYEPINFPANLIETIKIETAVIESSWIQTRSSKKEIYPTDVDSNINKLKTKKRRQLHTQKEKEQREVYIKQACKMRWKKALTNSIIKDNPLKVDRYGMLILSESINDTDTIGELRRYYRKNKYHERLITLNRYLFSHDNNLINSLCLASTLVKYSKESSSLSESKHLLETIEPYLNTLAPANIGSYYITQSLIDIKNGKRVAARLCLMNGIRYFDGLGGISYTLIEKYASSYTGNNINAGIEIIKALCGKTYKKNSDEIWLFVDKQIKQQKEKPLNNQEKIKYLIALSKLQKKSFPTDYNETLQEIAIIKA